MVVHRYKAHRKYGINQVKRVKGRPKKTWKETIKKMT